MIYTLRHFDIPLIRFSAESGAEPDVKILWVDDIWKKLLPLDLEEVSEKGIDCWVRNRLIPRNRSYVDTILSAIGLSINRPFDIFSGFPKAYPSTTAIGLRRRDLTEPLRNTTFMTIVSAARWGRLLLPATAAILPD